MTVDVERRDIGSVLAALSHVERGICTRLDEIEAAQAEILAALEVLSRRVASTSVASVTTIGIEKRTPIPAGEIVWGDYPPGG